MTQTNSNEQKFTSIQNLIILDRSGSMSSIAPQAIAGVNETIGSIRAAQRQNPEMKQYLTIVSFCGCHIERFCYNTPIEKVATLTPSDYQPCCSTPLYDTMGEALTTMRKAISYMPQTGVSITIITDGYENSSRKWTGPQIKALVEILKADGWLFAFIGANQDMKEIRFNLSIDNVMAFKATAEGTREMFEKEKKARMNWYNKMKDASCSDPTSTNLNYFED